MKLFSKAKCTIFGLYGLLLVAGCFSLNWMYAVAQFNQGQGNPFFPPEMNAARDAKTEFVIGDLGGVPVRIPHYFANYVEYDGDPGFGEKRKGPVPQRTYQSRLASFGFKVRFPDMAGRSSPELWRDFEKYSDPYWEGYYDSVSPWIDVGFSSGWIYPGDGFLEYVVNYKLSFNAEQKGLGNASKVYEYQQLPKIEHGLTVYAPPGIDPKTGKPYREDFDAKDLFVHRDQAGKVDTYIECTNHNLPSLKRTTCSQYISLEPGMRTEIRIHYPRYWLPHWQQIQRRVSDLVWSFKADAATKTAVSAASDPLVAP